MHQRRTNHHKKASERIRTQQSLQRVSKTIIKHKKAIKLIV